MQIRSHIPNMIEGVNSATTTFKTKDELLNIDWINNWCKNLFDGVPFWRYSEWKHGDEWLLMAEYKNDNQHKWWVVGFLSDKIGLPEFKAVLG